MHLVKSRSKKYLLLVLTLLMFGACKQSEFYEKVGLSEISNPPTFNGGGFETPGDTDKDLGNGDVETTPPVITGPPTVPEIPVVVIPPVVKEPETPIVVTPPVIVPETPVVVIPPVVVPETPVVVIPPVKEEPVPGIILNDRTELFTQNVITTQAVDILWVIDDSGSMADKQAAIAKNFENFIKSFIEEDIDFRMAITTTDATSKKNGLMVGDSSKLTAAAAKANKATFIKNFTTYAKVGTRGSATEKGLHCAESFFSRYSQSFLRPDAMLAIVIVSDEEDFSSKSVTHYLNSFQNLKENHAHVKVHSIVTLEKPKRGESIGHRYHEISTQTAGASTDIKKDFASTLADIGGEIVTLLDSFALNAAPYNNEVEVFVENVKVETGYKFNSAQRSITFDKTSLPAEGSRIEVRYKVVAKVLGAI